jgi:uncharacterized membrane protein
VTTHPSDEIVHTAFSNGNTIASSAHTTNEANEASNTTNKLINDDFKHTTASSFASSTNTASFSNAIIIIIINSTFGF